MKWIQPAIIAALCLWLLLIGAGQSKYIAAIIDAFFLDQCQGGAFYGVRTGDTRREVLNAISEADRNMTTEWYVEDPSASHPQLEYIHPVWAAPLVPPRFMEMDSWVLHRRGRHGDFRMRVDFDSGGRVACANVEVEIASF